MMSDIEYYNILPDMDMDDISFLKGSFVNGGVVMPRNLDNSGIDNQNRQPELNEEQQQRI